MAKWSCGVQLKCIRGFKLHQSGSKKNILEKSSAVVKLQKSSRVRTDQVYVLNGINKYVRKV